MQTFKQYINETNLDGLPSREIIHDSLINILTEDPYRFRTTNHKFNLETPGFELKRILFDAHINYAKNGWYSEMLTVIYSPIHFHESVIKMNVPFLHTNNGIDGFANIDNVKKIVSIMVNDHGTSGQLFFESADKRIVSIKSIVPEFDIYKTGTQLGNIIKLWFKLYNIFEDTPGTVIDKTIAIAQFIGVDRSDILKLKHRYGLLTKDDELTDKDTLDLF